MSDLTLSSCAPDDVESYIVAGQLGFHDDYNADAWGPGRALLEPDRAFGYKVGDRWVSTCSSYGRTLAVPGGLVDAAAVTTVTVAPDYQRRGLMSAMVRHQLDQLQEPVAVLWSTSPDLYGRYGYGAASRKAYISGPTRDAQFRAGVPQGVCDVQQVTEAAFLDAAYDLHSVLLTERPGGMARSEVWWADILNDHPDRRGGSPVRRYAVAYNGRGWTGYLAFRVHYQDGDRRHVTVEQLDAVDVATYARLWRYVLDLPLVRSFDYQGTPDEPLLDLLANPRALDVRLADATYVRLVDLEVALPSRTYSEECSVVMRIRDDQLPINAGSWRLTIDRDGAASALKVNPATSPHLELDVSALGAAYLGGTTVAQLHRAGLVKELVPGSVAILSRAMRGDREPFCRDYF
jgi:predicted acetyltransferase